MYTKYYKNSKLIIKRLCTKMSHLPTIKYYFFDILLKNAKRRAGALGKILTSY